MESPDILYNEVLDKNGDRRRRQNILVADLILLSCPWDVHGIIHLMVFPVIHADDV